jgi:pimeloyl-ACP methyl ester carboxylesterase
VRIFEERPFFAVTTAAPAADSQSLSFRTADGISLKGSYWKCLTPERAGVLLFCHEFSSDRWSCRDYCDHLRRAGFDVMSFDFRNHGESEACNGYQPLQWLTEYEVDDVRAAISYLTSRPDADSRGVGIYGISKGGSAALVAAADSPHVVAVVTDGAFPTRGMQLAYMRRWVTIYTNDGLALRPFVREWLFKILATWARRITERRRHCRLVDVEEAVARLGRRRLLMVHGERDSYVTPDVAREFFSNAPPHAELWSVPDARHNECLRVAGDEYRDRIRRFFQTYLGTGRRRVVREPVVERAS